MLRMVWAFPVALSLGLGSFAHAGPEGEGSTYTTPAPEAQRVDDDLTLDELPEAVRRAVLQEVGDGHIESIERDRERGKIVYELEYETKEGVEYKVHFAEDGSILRKKRD